MRYDQLPTPTESALHTLVSFATDPIHEVLADWAERYGDRVVFTVLGRTRLFLNEPALVGQVLDTDADRYYKHSPVEEMRPHVRQSVFIANGAEWKPKRHAHPFESPWMEPWFQAVLPEVQRMMRERLLPLAGPELDLTSITRRLSFDVFCWAVFGKCLDDRLYRAFKSLYDDAALRMQLGIVASPVTLDPFAASQREAWWEAVTALVEDRANAPEPSLLAYLARRGTTLEASLLVDEVSTILFAGVGPVGVTMASLLYELGRRPEVLAGLRDAGRSAATTADLATGPIARTVSETLRVWPTVSVLSRTPSQAGLIGDIEVDADIDIFLSPWALHRSPRVWEDPLRFSPDRFQTAPHPWTFMPFGTGPRTCVGQPWGLFLLRLFTATVAAGWEVEVPQDTPYRLSYYSGFARPTHALHGRIRAL
ncbi:MAG: cytochrome P450 [Pseudomonadota bacterium]|nr:cytochrome P450 [Pseudomonadota bacterium]